MKLTEEQKIDLNRGWKLWWDEHYNDHTDYHDAFIAGYEQSLKDNDLL